MFGAENLTSIEFVVLLGQNFLRHYDEALSVAKAFKEAYNAENYTEAGHDYSRILRVLT